MKSDKLTLTDEVFNDDNDEWYDDDEDKDE